MDKLRKIGDRLIKRLLVFIAFAVIGAGSVIFTTCKETITWDDPTYTNNGQNQSTHWGESGPENVYCNPQFCSGIFNSTANGSINPQEYRNAVQSSWLGRSDRKTHDIRGVEAQAHFQPPHPWAGQDFVPCIDQRDIDYASSIYPPMQ